ncbi:MAG: folate-binding protein YgfZ [Verrucomicrobiae bacterium]|nr:folate-binding protein YgfZ [Verrucomicrobiae bacterium]
MDSADYDALATSAAFLPARPVGLLELTGEDRVRFLNGQATNDIQALKDGQSVYTAFTNAKGKMRCDGHVMGFADKLWIATNSGAAPKLAAELDKFIIADDVVVSDRSQEFRLISLRGPRCREANSDLGGAIVIPVFWGGENAFDLLVTAATAATWEKRIARTARKVGPDAFETRRVELGVPEFGVDMDENTLPPEAGLESRAISYTKGCYIGQEVISRIKSVGHVNRHLFALEISGDAQRGAKLTFEDGADAGAITSVATLPGGRRVALGYVKRRGDSPVPGKLKGPGFEAILRGAPASLPTPAS